MRTIVITTETSLPARHPLAEQESLIDDLRECGRLFHLRGWSVGTSSNYSAVAARDPVELIVTASGKDKGRLARHDFVRIGMDGKPVGDQQPKSSAETMLHVVLAERPDVGAILHTHSPWATLLSDYYFGDGGIGIAGYEMLKGLEGVHSHEEEHWIPIFENTQNIPELADQVRKMLANDSRMSHGFLIRRHGLYTWGRDVFAARRHIEVYEFLFECLGKKLMLAPK